MKKKIHPMHKNLNNNTNITKNVILNTIYIMQWKWSIQYECMYL